MNTQLHEILYTDSQDMLVLSPIVASHYYNCCTDGVSELTDSPLYGGTEDDLTKQNWDSQHDEKKNLYLPNPELYYIYIYIYIYRYICTYIHIYHIC
jgi:hypothetical protein